MTHSNAIGKIREAAETAIEGHAVMIMVWPKQAVIAWTGGKQKRPQVVCRGELQELENLLPKLRQIFNLMVTVRRSGQLGWSGGAVADGARVQ